MIISQETFENYIRLELRSASDSIKKKDGRIKELERAIRKFTTWKFSKKFDSRDLNVMVCELRKAIK